MPSLEKIHGYDSARGGGQSEMRAALPRAPRAAVGVRRGGSVMLALALFGCFCVGDGTAVRLTQQQASLSYARTSIFTGMPDGLRTTVESIMDSRLSPPTRSVLAAITVINGHLFRAKLAGKKLPKSRVQDRVACRPYFE